MPADRDVTIKKSRILDLGDYTEFGNIFILAGLLHPKWIHCENHGPWTNAHSYFYKLRSISLKCNAFVNSLPLIHYAPRHQGTKIANQMRLNVDPIEAILSYLIYLTHL